MPLLWTNQAIQQLPISMASDWLERSSPSLQDFAVSNNFITHHPAIIDMIRRYIPSDSEVDDS